MKTTELDKLGKPYKIYGDHFEQGAIQQFIDAMKQPDIVQGALMPDAHQGYTLPIGGVVACEKMIYPAFIGFDIGCGVCAVELSIHKDDLDGKHEHIFNEIYRRIPVGFKRHTSNHITGKELLDLKYLNRISNAVNKIISHDGTDQITRQLGTLGGGNHFIEIGSDEHNKVWAIVHSGSRGIGWKTARHYMCIASDSNKPKEGFYGFDVNSDIGKQYIIDMKFCLSFALANRTRLVEDVIDIIDATICHELAAKNFINRNHNHAELKDGLWIHRKGATHAEDGMMGVIPGNMRDGSFIVRGKGCSESLYSSSHGAGRTMSRRQAKSELSMETFRDEMTGITSKVAKKTLDESPGAYKDIFDVMDHQKDLVDIVRRVKPIINVKA